MTPSKLINEFYDKCEHKNYFNKALKLSFFIIILFSIAVGGIAKILNNNFGMILLYLVFSFFLYAIIFFKITKSRFKNIEIKDKRLMLQILKDNKCYNEKCMQQLINYSILQTKKTSLEHINIFNILSILSLLIDKKEESILGSIVIYILIQDFLYIKDLIKIHTDYEYIHEMLNNILFEYNINTNRSKIKRLLEILIN